MHLHVTLDDVMRLEAMSTVDEAVERGIEYVSEQAQARGGYMPDWMLDSLKESLRARVQYEFMWRTIDRDGLWEYPGSDDRVAAG